MVSRFSPNILVYFTSAYYHFCKNVSHRWTHRYIHYIGSSVCTDVSAFRKFNCNFAVIECTKKICPQDELDCIPIYKNRLCALSVPSLLYSTAYQVAAFDLRSPNLSVYTSLWGLMCLKLRCKMQSMLAWP